MSLKIRRLSNAIGAEICGADLDEVIASPELFRLVHAAFLAHNILLFRNQKIDRAQHIAFSRLFGPLDPHDDLVAERHPDFPELLKITNEPQQEDQPSPTANTGRHWHSDMSFTVRPALGSVLRAFRLPDVGGDTMFANMYLALDTLSDGMKALLDGLFSVQYLGANRDTGNGSAQRSRKVAQPIVRTHPETGRKALYVGEKSRCIEHMTEEESAPLLAYLCHHAAKPEFVYRHQWRPDDIIIWDNRCTIHMALADFDRRQRRYMERTTIVGAPSGHYVADS